MVKPLYLEQLQDYTGLVQAQFSLNNEDVTEISVEKRGIGLIFQRLLLMPHLDVWGNLRLGQKTYDEEEINVMLI